MKVTFSASGMVYNIDPTAIELVSDLRVRPETQPCKATVRTKSGLDIHIEQTREEALAIIEEELAKNVNPFQELLALLKTSLQVNQ